MIKLLSKIKLKIIANTTYLKFLRESAKMKLSISSENLTKMDMYEASYKCIVVYDS